MNLLHLRYVLEVARTGSITQAADNLYIGQPNLSRAVRELEESIGFAVFRRSSKGVSPTPKGEEFLRQARSILAQIDELETRFSPGRESSERFKVCVPPSCCYLQAFAWFLSSVQLSPDSQVVFQLSAPLQALRGVAEQTFSLGLIRLPSEREAQFLDLLREEGLSWEIFWEFERQAVLSPGWEPSTREELEATGIELLCPETDAEPSAPDRRTLLCGPDTRLDLLPQLPAAYFWDSPVPEEFRRLHGLAARSFPSSEGPWRDLLIYREHSRLSPWEEQFLSCLRRAKNTLH